MPNHLYYGDNLDVLKQHVHDESVDLVYLDPPFKSNQDYNVLFAEKSGKQAAAQIKVFGDTWHWDEASSASYREVVEGSGPVAQAMRAFRTAIGDNDMLAYLSMMAPRLLELRRVMKTTASIYLHCDQTSSHYLKLLMDAVFGPKNFRNELVWHYTKFEMRDMRKYTKNTDRILFYVKDARSQYLFEAPTVHLAVPKSYKRKAWSSALKRIVNVRDRDGQLIYDAYADAKVDDVWEIPFIGATARERLGYPTQKPEALLERIIAASSRKGELVLDPFCGCGTAVAVAQRLGRQWIGVDVTHLAITLIKHRLLTAFWGRAEFKVTGEPISAPDAEQLAQDDPYQFQVWALGLVGARPSDGVKKGADKGIDGRFYFHDEGPNGRTKQVIISVKAGRLQPAFVQQLRGVVDKEHAEIGVLITMQRPTRAMRAEAASAEFYDSAWGHHPRLQMLTVADLLNGAKINYPPRTQVDATFKRAPAAKSQEPEKLYLPLDVPAPAAQHRVRGEPQREPPPILVDQELARRVAETKAARRTPLVDQELAQRVNQLVAARRTRQRQGKRRTRDVGA